jgi:hypothetical protein
MIEIINYVLIKKHGRQHSPTSVYCNLVGYYDVLEKHHDNCQNYKLGISLSFYMFYLLELHPFMPPKGNSPKALSSD